jgi:hypothetical protein
MQAVDSEAAVEAAAALFEHATNAARNDTSLANVPMENEEVVMRREHSLSIAEVYSI